MTFIVAIFVLWLVFVGYWLVSAVGAKTNTKPPWKGLAVRVILAIAVVAYFRSSGALTFRLHSPRHQSLALSMAGVALCLTGVSLAIWARRNLGRNWGMPMSIKAEPELVTSGPYAYIRHPIYTGVILAMAGSAMVIGWWWGALLIVFGTYFVISAKTEERRLSRLMPQQYPAYMRRTKMLIPYVF